MKKIAVIAISVIIMGMIIGSVNAASLGYIDIQKIFSTYDKTKKAQEQIREKEQKIQEEIAIKQKEVEKAKEKNMSDDDIKIIISKIEKYFEPKRADLIAAQQKLTSEIRNDIVKATEAVAKKAGIETVLDKKAVISGGIDITDKVIDLLNKK